MKDHDILSKVNTPTDLKNLPKESIPTLCSEMRDFLIEAVEKNGGHLASNLGLVELTVAIHSVFDCPSDHIIFDVGHQAYVHKMLTERRERFSDLRIPGGLSGFTSRKEGKYDCFGAGHSSTSVSAALGFAEADKRDQNGAYTVCVIGDGAYTGGMVHEALNNCKDDLPLIIILNENGMSISKNGGAFASYISKFRFSRGYIGWKRGTISVLDRIPLLGPCIRWVLSCIRNFIKRIIYKPNYFEELGLYYIGALDGHNYNLIVRALKEAKRSKRTTVIHVKTIKGKGYKPAELEPGIYHSVSSKSIKKSTFHSVFAEELCDIASYNDGVFAITAAMGVGTGLDAFGSRFKDRYYDVGIAEEHALTFAAGLAAAGKHPFVAIYSTFLQRGYDNILHDIALQRLPVTIAVDRAGISVADGATHHGIFDVSFLSHIPDIQIFSPSTYGSLRETVRFASSYNGPTVIRYSNLSESETVKKVFYPNDNYGDFGIRYDFDKNHVPDNIYITYGSIVENVLSARMLLKKDGIESGVILLERIKPIGDIVDELMHVLKKVKRILFVEEGIKNGGIGMIFGDMLREKGLFYQGIEYNVRAIEDSFLIPDCVCNIYDYAGLSAEKLYNFFKK